MPPAASTSNPPRFLALFGLPHASHSFNVQSTTLSCSFWTSAMPPAASTSNPSRFLAPFGLPHASRSFNVQSARIYSTTLDFCLLLCCFDVQSDTLSYSFWTSACFPAALTSNPSRFLAPFGLPHASHSFNVQSARIYSTTLDFCLLPRSFNVQSDTLSCSFWTSACFPAASTSNPPRFLTPFGLLPCIPQL